MSARVILAPKGDPRVAGTWQPDAAAGLARLRPDGVGASYTCPQCWEPLWIPARVIDRTGRVKAKVVCFNFRNCSFRSLLHLEGWEEFMRHAAAVLLVVLLAAACCACAGAGTAGFRLGKEGQAAVNEVAMAALKLAEHHCDKAEAKRDLVQGHWKPEAADAAITAASGLRPCTPAPRPTPSPEGVF